MLAPKIIGLFCLQLIIPAQCRSLEEAESSSKDADAAKKPFSLNDVISNTYTSDVFNGSWISETEILYRIDDLLLKFDATVQKSEIIARNSAFNHRLEFSLSADKNYVLIRNLTTMIYRHSSVSTFKIFNVKSKIITSLADGQQLSLAVWAPRGSALVYVLKNDIYYHQLNGDSVETRRLTFDGKSQAVYNGVPDWVYEEEVFGTDRTMWFSPNGEHLAFATFNDTEVHEAVIMRYGDAGKFQYQYPIEEKFRYPKSGTPNPRVTLNLIDLTDHGSSIIPLKTPVHFVGSEPILFSVLWFDARTVAAVWANRVQNVSHLASYSLDGQWQPLLSEESPDGWLLYLDQPPIHHSGYVYVIQPRPIGNVTLGNFGHVIRYRLLNGALDHELDLTPGAYWIHNVYGVNDLRQVLYFTASPPGEPSQKHFYEVSLQLSKDETPAPQCISCNFKSPEGNPCKYVNLVKFSIDYSHYVLSCSGPDPAVITVYDLENTELYVWSISPVLRKKLKQRVLPRQRDIILQSHGFDARVRLFLPENFDPSQKYPLLVNVYGGPQSQRITDSFNVGYETYMSSNKSVVYAWIDGRGSSCKGTANMYTVYRHLGNAEMEDQINVTSQLQSMFPWIDSKRTGIWGWSYGGYSTATILTKDADNVFKCGISVSPVTHWIYYDSIYTERYMGLPTENDNLKNYMNSDVMSNVKKLEGKKFMLIHGTGDDNVHYQQSMMLSKALSEADILYNQVSYPDEAHHLTHVTNHLYHTMDKFWSNCFEFDK